MRKETSNKKRDMIIWATLVSVITIVVGRAFSSIKPMVYNIQAVVVPAIYLGFYIMIEHNIRKSHEKEIETYEDKIQEVHQRKGEIRGQLQKAEQINEQFQQDYKQLAQRYNQELENRKRAVEILRDIAEDKDVNLEEYIE